MSGLRRRQLIAATTATVFGLAGCTAEDGASNKTEAKRDSRSIYTECIGYCDTVEELEVSHRNPFSAESRTYVSVKFSEWENVSVEVVVYDDDDVVLWRQDKKTDGHVAEFKETKEYKPAYVEFYVVKNEA